MNNKVKMQAILNEAMIQAKKISGISGRAARNADTRKNINRVNEGIVYPAKAGAFGFPGDWDNTRLGWKNSDPNSPNFGQVDFRMKGDFLHKKKFQDAYALVLTDEDYATLAEDFARTYILPGSFHGYAGLPSEAELPIERYIDKKKGDYVQYQIRFKFRVTKRETTELDNYDISIRQIVAEVLIDDDYPRKGSDEIYAKVKSNFDIEKFELAVRNYFREQHATFSKQRDRAISGLKRHAVRNRPEDNYETRMRFGISPKDIGPGYVDTGNFNFSESEEVEFDSPLYEELCKDFLNIVAEAAKKYGKENPQKFVNIAKRHIKKACMQPKEWTKLSEMLKNCKDEADAKKIIAYLKRVVKKNDTAKNMDEKSEKTNESVTLFGHSIADYDVAKLRKIQGDITAYPERYIAEGMTVENMEYLLEEISNEIARKSNKSGAALESISERFGKFSAIFEEKDDEMDSNVDLTAGADAGAADDPFGDIDFGAEGDADTDNTDTDNTEDTEETEEEELTAVKLTIKKKDYDALVKELKEADIAESDIEAIDIDEKNDDDDLDVKISADSIMALKDYLEKKGIDLEEEIGGEISSEDDEDDKDEESGDSDSEDADKSEDGDGEDGDGDGDGFGDFNAEDFDNLFQ